MEDPLKGFGVPLLYGNLHKILVAGVLIPFITVKGHNCTKYGNMVGDVRNSRLSVKTWLMELDLCKWILDTLQIDAFFLGGTQWNSMCPSVLCMLGATFWPMPISHKTYFRHFTPDSWHCIVRLDDSLLKICFCQDCSRAPGWSSARAEWSSGVSKLDVGQNGRPRGPQMLISLV